MNNNAVSYIRVVAMLMIVTLHSLNYWGGWNFTDCPVSSYQKTSEILNNIALPIFFFVSGYLYYANIDRYLNMGRKLFILKKAKHLIIPYLFWAVVQMLIMPERYNPLQVLYGVSHLWFLLVLFEIFLIAIILKDIWVRMSFWQEMALIIVFLIAYFPVSIITHNFLRLTSVVSSMPLFICGIVINKRKNVIKNISVQKITVITFLSFLMIVLSVIFDNSLKHQIAKLSALIFVSCGVGYSLGLKLPLIPAVKLLDRNSMGIYILHHILIMWCLQHENVRIYLNSHIGLGPFLIFAIAFLVSLIISSLLRSNKFTRLLLG